MYRYFRYINILLPSIHMYTPPASALRIITRAVVTHTSPYALRCTFKFYYPLCIILIIILYDVSLSCWSPRHNYPRATTVYNRSFLAKTFLNLFLKNLYLYAGIIYCKVRIIIYITINLVYTYKCIAYGMSIME